jgi:hypothetical protein
MTFTARPLRLSTADAGFDAALQARLHWSADTDAGIEQAWPTSWPTCSSAAMRRCWNTPTASTGGGASHGPSSN